MHYPPGHGSKSWQQKRDQSLVPDNWLYGLDKLADSRTLAVRDAEVAPLSAIGRSILLARLVRRPNDRVRHPHSSEVVSLAWDEIRGARMLANGKHTVKMCGVIWCLDEYMSGRNYARAAAAKRILKRMHSVWCLSETQASMLEQWLGPYGPRVFSLKFGIDTNFYSRQEACPTDTEDIKSILSLGFDRDRDHQEIVRTILEVQRSLPGTRAAMQCPPEIALPPSIERLPRLSHVEVVARYERASVTLVATRPNLHFSGMTVALESMAMGVPVVVTKSPGSAEYLGTEGPVAAGNVNRGRQAEGVLRFLTDPGLAAAASEQGIKHVRRNHSSSVMAADLRGEILRTVAESGSSNDR